jgi:hypothetical protein
VEDFASKILSRNWRALFAQVKVSAWSLALPRGISSAARQAARWPEKPPTHEELLSRLTIMRNVLALGAAILVVGVLCSKILIEWSTSLLANSQQKAIAPIGEAVNLMYGAFGTIALIAGLGPALAAFVLDRQAFRATLADNRQAETTAEDRAPANAAPAQRFADDLGFAVWPSISAAIAVFSPLLAPLLAELVKSIVKNSPS